jgi:hypothetical protein
VNVIVNSSELGERNKNASLYSQVGREQNWIAMIGERVLRQTPLAFNKSFLAQYA